MASVKSASLCWILLSVWFRSSASKEVKDITAKPDETVTLPCEATGITNIGIVEWIRPDLNNAVVCLYRNGRCETDDQLSLQGRVQLNKDWKNGNASLIVNNVTTNDAGRYECYVKGSETKRRKRATDEDGAELLQTIKLNIQDSGGDKNGGDKNGHVGLTVGLSVVGVILVSVGVVGFLIFRRRFNEQNSY